MIVTPKVRGFICTAAHPEGCKAAVDAQIDYVQQQGELPAGPKKVLVIGCSTGYGLATRIVQAFAAGAATLGVCFEKAASGKRTASAGWYNTSAFEQAAADAGLYARTLNGDAFSDAMKAQVIAQIKQDLGQVDAVIYSLASPRRTDPDSGEVYQSVLKTVGQAWSNKTVDVMRGELKDVTIDAASAEEIEQTIAVMGGADLERWIEQLLAAEVLAAGVKVYAYSYIGPELTYPIYKDGTIGRAKDDVQRACDKIQQQLTAIGGSAQVAVNKAVVTQASAAIPVVPLYLSVLRKVLAEKDLQEGCIEQMYRLARDFIYTASPKAADAQGRLRVDDWELRADVQEQVAQIWGQLTTDNLEALTDLAGYQEAFFRLFGFKWPGVDYAADVDIERSIPSLRADSEQAG